MMSVGIRILPRRKDRDPRNPKEVLGRNVLIQGDVHLNLQSR